MKDFWGNPALDFGAFKDMTKKYTDKVFASVCENPFGDVYVVFVGNEGDEDKVLEYLSEYDTKMEGKGITAYGSGIHWGDALQGKKMNAFQGGAFSGI
jgi:hypothetical protein